VIERLNSIKILSEVVLSEKKLSSLLNENTSGRKNQVYNIVYGVLRYYNPINSYIDTKTKKLPLKVKLILSVAIYELIYTSSKAYGIVSDSLKIAEKLGVVKFKPVINAVLRNFERNKDSEIKNIEKFPYFNDFFMNILKEFPNINIASFLRKIPPIFLVPNTFKTDIDELSRLLLEQNIDHEVLDKYNIKTIKTFDRSVLSIKEFSEGKFYIQDLAAQITSSLIDKDFDVLDLCSAPGGKTLFLAINNRTTVTSIDKSTKRLMKIYENINRLDLKNVKIIESDIFDLNIKSKNIIIDPPCSAYGVLRRNLDLVLKEKDLDELKFLQLNMLKKAFDLLEPSGKLIYSVCTFTKKETFDVINEFLKERKDAFLHSIPNFLKKFEKSGCILTMPDQDEMDIHFIAIIGKK
jgi:16S rRNA (cytosine967-C5)-methyltransferase